MLVFVVRDVVRAAALSSQRSRSMLSLRCGKIFCSQLSFTHRSFTVDHPVLSFKSSLMFGAIYRPKKCSRGMNKQHSISHTLLHLTYFYSKTTNAFQLVQPRSSSKTSKTRQPKP